MMAKWLERLKALLATWDTGAAAVVLVGYLALIWLYPYVPTQDGPSHVANALILKDHGKPGTRYEDFYVIAWEPFPNWASHALLAGLMYVVPPLVAEKILISIYLIGFAFSFRYFIRGFGAGSPFLVMAALLLPLNHCFWMGFYNFCLGLIWFWLVVGYLLRRRADLRGRDAAVVAVLFSLAYFTHLSAFCLCSVASLWLAFTVLRRPVWASLLITAAILPGATLAAGYVRSRGSAGEDAETLRTYLAGWCQDTRPWQRLDEELQLLDRRLFGTAAHEAWSLGLAVILLYSAFLWAGLLLPEPPDEPSVERTARWPIACLAIAAALAFFLLPDYLGPGRGGYLKSRLALIAGLLFLACCHESACRWLRHGLRGATLCLLAANFFAVASHIHTSNEDLREFTAGMDALGGERLLFVSRGPMGQTADPLFHAADYYCLKSANINLDNYEAAYLNFPLRFLPGIEPASNQEFATYANRNLVNTLLFWLPHQEQVIETPAGFRTVFAQGRLTIMERERR